MSLTQTVTISGIDTIGPPGKPPFPTSMSMPAPTVMVDEALFMEEGIREEEEKALDALMLEAAIQAEEVVWQAEKAIAEEEAIVDGFAMQADEAARAVERAAQNKLAAKAILAAKAEKAAEENQKIK